MAENAQCQTKASFVPDIVLSTVVLNLKFLTSESTWDSKQEYKKKRSQKLSMFS
jgi:ATP-dependent phosphoenolpyruvate carboxykinase